MQTTALMAIDPGGSGGAALLWPDSPDPEVHKCPKEWAELTGLIRKIGKHAGLEGYTLKAVLEKAQPFPARMVPCKHCKGIIRQPQGSKSIWTYAVNYQTWRAGLFMSRISQEPVAPAVWQRCCGALPRGQSSKEKLIRKRAIKAIAQERFPKIRVTLWNADALMMLVWFQRQEAAPLTSPF